MMKRVTGLLGVHEGRMTRNVCVSVLAGCDLLSAALEVGFS